jgi:hypothetical protein
MWSRPGLIAVCSAFLTLFLAPAAAPAARRLAPITGRAPAGYTVIALALNGHAADATVQAGGRFRVVPTAARVTLQLRAPDGTYGGPVVVAPHGPHQVVVGVRAGARLGVIRVANGFGKVAGVLSGALDTSRLAFARRRRPTGARRLGHVRRWPSLGRSGGTGPSARTLAKRRGGDLDQDGIPDAIDVDDDGDLRLDNVDKRSSLGGSIASAQDLDPYQPTSLLNVGLEESYLAERAGYARGVAGYPLNDDVPRATSPEDRVKLRDLAISQRSLVLFPLPRGDAELDCGGLIYCRAGGSGRDVTRMHVFPDDFDADQDGFGLMTDSRPLNPSRDGFGTTAQIDRPIFALAPGTGLRTVPGSDGIGSGDQYLERFPGGLVQPTTLGYVFDSVPAIKSYGQEGATTDIAYPVPEDGPGTERDPLPITVSRPLTLVVWRPQRRALPGEAGCSPDAATCSEGVDIGGLTYVVAGKTNEQARQTWHCPPSAYGLPPGASSGAARVGAGGVTDLAPDRPSDSARVVSFTVTLSQCTNDGSSSPWTGFPSRDVYVTAVSRYGDAAEGGGLSFKGG